MQAPQLTLRPSISNALIPELAKNAMYVLPFALIASLIAYGVAAFTSLILSTLLAWILLASALLILIPEFTVLITLLCTRYEFFSDHVVKTFRLIFIKKESVLYTQIVNIKTNISIWDRLCNAGDIILYTAEDIAFDVKLKYIPRPQRVEQHLYKLIRNTTSFSSESPGYASSMKGRHS